MLKWIWRVAQLFRVDDCVGGGGTGLAGRGDAGGAWAIMGCGCYVHIAEH